MELLCGLPSVLIACLKQFGKCFFHFHLLCKHIRIRSECYKGLLDSLKLKLITSQQYWIGIVIRWSQSNSFGVGQLFWWAGNFLKAPCFRSPWVCSLLEGLYDFSSDSWRMKTYEDNLADAKTFRRQRLFWNVLCSWSERGQPLSEAVRARCKGRQFVWRSYGLKFRALSLFPEHLSSKWIMQVTFL